MSLEEAYAHAQEIYAAFESWLKIFQQYVTLLTKQGTWNRISGGEQYGRLELLFDDAAELTRIVSNMKECITITEGENDESLHLEQFKEAARYASEGLRPRLQYLMLLEAYRARRNGDYRKTIIDGATALEVCLTECSRKELDKQGE